MLIGQGPTKTLKVPHGLLKDAEIVLFRLLIERRNFLHILLEELSGKLVINQSDERRKGFIKGGLHFQNLADQFLFAALIILAGLDFLVISNDYYFGSVVLDELVDVT